MNYSNKVGYGWLLTLCLLGMARLGAQDQKVVLHGFRNPATGVEIRQAAVGFVVGFYPTTVDSGPEGENRTTWFTKTGIFWYPFGFDAGELGLLEPYMGVSLVQGLGNAWNVSESILHGSGMTFDAGLRWALLGGLDLRLGAVLLVGFDGRLYWNPAPGIGRSAPLP
jgi:hypothetical protein